MKTRIFLAVGLMFLLACPVVAQTGRKYFQFEVINELGILSDEQFDVTVYDANSGADATATCYTTAGGTTGFTYQNITTGVFGFWYSADVDIKIVSDTTGNAVRVNDLTPTDHRIVLSRNQFVESASLTVGGLTVSGATALSNTLTVGADAAGYDVTFYAKTTLDSLVWDQDGATNVGALTFNNSAILFNQATVDYTFVAANNALSLTATDNSAAGLTFGATGTNGLDVTFQSATAGDLVKFDAGAKTLTATDVQIIASGGLIGTRTIVTNTGTDNVAVTAAQSGTVFVSNRDTGAEQTYTLPPAAAGLTYTFIDIRTTAGDDLKVIAGAEDKINNGTAAAYIVDSGDDTYGVMVTLTAIDATQWIIVEAEPVKTSWTAGGP